MVILRLDVDAQVELLSHGARALLDAVQADFHLRAMVVLFRVPRQAAAAHGPAVALDNGNAAAPDTPRHRRRAGARAFESLHTMPCGVKRIQYLRQRAKMRGRRMWPIPSSGPSFVRGASATGSFGGDESFCAPGCAIVLGCAPQSSVCRGRSSRRGWRLAARPSRRL